MSEWSAARIQLRRVPRVPVVDAVGLLTAYVVVLVAVPSRLVFAPLGGAGTPAQMLGMALAVWWVTLAIGQRRRATLVWQPLRVTMLLFAAAVIASYVAAATRPIESAELRSADLGLLSVISWIGVLFVAMDHVGSRARLDTLLRRVAVAGGALATLGLLQFVTKLPFTNLIQIPGLSSNNALVSVSSRSGLTRPAGTALHPIEFGAVLTMILPLALHYAMTDSGKTMLRRWYPVAAICVAVPISISRSAIVSAIVVLAFLVPTWTKSVRRRAYLALTVLSGTLYLLVPGLLGTLTGLFSGLSSDDSAKSRTGSYDLAGAFIGRAPMFGRGYSTFLPTYRILDNQYLKILVEAGVVGLITLLALFASGVLTARTVRRLAPDPQTRQLAQALAASVASALVSFALFDAFSFPMASSLIFLLLGAIGAARRTQLLGR